MRDLSRDELGQIAKIRSIKNYQDMKKEDSIISLLKSKQSIAKNGYCRNRVLFFAWDLGAIFTVN